ncbi:MAG: RIP metalloprotease RseP, partial [Cyanobacteria bacterium P01_C01_bin.72]
MSVLAAISVVLLLIVVHEFGHFAAARLQKIRVNRFSIGFGPTLLKYQGEETEYAIRAIPLGGYVGFPDDDPESTIPPDDPDLLRNRPVLDRAIVISAGVIANLIFAYFLLVGQAFTIGFQDINYKPGVVIPQILSQTESAAAQAGVKPGDIILKIDDVQLGDSADALENLRQEIQKSPNRPLTLTIKRGTEIVNLDVTPDVGQDGKGKIGVMLAPNGDIVRRRASGIVEGFTAGANEFQRIIQLTVQGFWQLINNFQENAQQVAGPVAIVAVG